MPGTFSPPPRVSDLDMHHGTCVTHVQWCMQGSLTSGFLWSRWRGNVPGIPGACATRNLRIWQEAHSDMQRGQRHGHTFRLIGPLCRESISYWWIPHHKKQLTLSFNGFVVVTKDKHLNKEPSDKWNDIIASRWYTWDVILMLRMYTRYGDAIIHIICI